MGYSIGVVCSVGVGPDRGGRSDNEDNYLICQDGRTVWREGEAERMRPAEGQGLLVAVADGMGGEQGGEMAATVAVRVLAKLYGSGAPTEPARALRRYVLDAHRRLYERAREQGPVTMGTTLTAAWVTGGHVHWVQVGDSRLYLYRNGRMERLTSDHTRGEFAQRDGRAPGQQPDALVQGFIFGSRGLGDDASIRVEASLDSGRRILQRGDRLLLCTDGLWSVVDDVSIADVLRHTPDPQAAAVACLERAIARGSTDNITALVARVDEPTLDEG